MKKQRLWVIVVVLFLAMVVIGGCGKDDEAAPIYSVTVSGTLIYAGWTTGDYVVAIYPDGVAASETGYIGFADVTGVASPPYTVPVTTAATNAYAFAWNETTGEGNPDIPGVEFFGCSAVFAVGAANVTGVDITLELNATSCNSHFTP